MLRILCFGFFSTKNSPFGGTFKGPQTIRSVFHPPGMGIRDSRAKHSPAATRRHHCSQQSGPLPQATKEPGKDVGSRSRTPGAVASLPARPSRPGAAAASPPSPPASLREHAQCLARFANCRGPRRAPRPARRARPRRSPHPPVVRLRRPGDRDFRAGGGP